MIFLNIVYYHLLNSLLNNGKVNDELNLCLSDILNELICIISDLYGIIRQKLLLIKC